MVSACVLVVDDNPDILAVLRALLELKGFEVMTAEDGQAAWEFLHQCRPDVILSDMRMPKVDGSELIRRVRNSPEFSAIPIVAMSAYGSGGMAEAKGLGAAATLRKPTDFYRLVDILRQVLAERDAS
jgi:two-component system chemotaxis response regulator CheY